MNTTPTTKAKPTEGPYTIESVPHPNAPKSLTIYKVKNKTGTIVLKSTGEGTAKMFHEMMNVHHETGLTPRELVERMNNPWVYDRTPNAYETGNWDGKRSSEVLAVDKEGKTHLARVYEGVMDGSHFVEWVDNTGFTITGRIVKWMKIPD